MHARQHSRRALIKRLGCGVVLGCVVGSAARGEEGGPRAVIAGLDDAFLEVMQGADELGYAGRYARLEPVLMASFDFPFMIRIATGQAWRELDAEQKARLTEAFTEMSIATYAARFDGHAGERFEITGDEPGPRDTVLVRSRIIRPEGEPVGLDYLLRETTEGWRVVDILLDGKYSELARQRAEFAAILDDGGAAGLIATLEDKTAELAAGG